MQRGHSTSSLGTVTSQPLKMSGFGGTPAFSFGAAAAAPSTAFGGFSPPAATGFGAPAATGFGAPATTGFGTPATTGFGGFGAPATTGFGAPAATGFGGFGAPAATGFGGFGAPAATGFGAPAATGFGAPAATGFGGFGNIGMAGFGAPTLTPSLATQPGITNFFLGDRVLDIQLSYAPLLDSQTGFPVARTTPDRPYVANEAMCKFDTILYNPKPLGSNTRLQLNTGSRWEQVGNYAFMFPWRSFSQPFAPTSLPL